MRVALAALIALAGCARAPVGMQFANPNCIIHCVVEAIDTTGSPALATLTATLGATSTATGGTRSSSTTTTTTDTGG